MDKKLFAAQLIEKLNEKGISLWEEDGKIRYKAYNGIFTSQDKNLVKEYRDEIVRLLRDMSKKVEIKEDLINRFQPFELTDVQQAYLLGRNTLFEYGDVACHIYLQLRYQELDLKKVQQIWNQLIRRHEMLRAVIYENGYQAIMENYQEFIVNDFGNMPLDAIMKDMGHSKYEIGTWPYFSVGISYEKGNAYMHFSIEFIIADWTSIWILLKEFETLYFNKTETLPEIHVSYRDYVKAEKNMRNGIKYKTDKAYWWKRIDEFAIAPKLPIKRWNREEKAHFSRKYIQLPKHEWEKIKNLANQNSLTPTTLVLMAYAATLERFSENKKIALNLTVLNRMSVHEDIHKVVGDFTSINLLEIDFECSNNFLEIARKTNERMFEDLDHRLYSGIEVMREIGRRKGREAAFMPFVFTSAIGLLSAIGSDSIAGLTNIGISQTPQVFIDCQVMDGDFGMQVNWDIRDGVFENQIVDDMFECFSTILEEFIKETPLDKIIPITLPQDDRNIMKKSNCTKKELSYHLLHEKIIEQAITRPEKIAIISGKKKITYKELINIAVSIYVELKKYGFIEEQPIIICMEKSYYQVAAALAILAAKAVYVPVSPEQGEARINSIIKRTNAKIIVTNIDSKINNYPDINYIYADTLIVERDSTLKLCCDDNIKRLAYIIFTSGSTGEPKGVAITHEAAVNTIEDINERYQINSADIILGISEFNFDLSVYDIFGILSKGGTLVYPEDKNKRNPAYLYTLMKKYGVTIWNSVPALLQMLMIYTETVDNAEFNTLRLILLSGDWIPNYLPDAFSKYAVNAKIVSLGGATEGSIWSIYHNYTGPVEGFLNIPYGTPLANQGFRILDSKLQDCPIGVKGELYIIGKGVAQGYYNDTIRTQEQFIIHPKEGIRMYKTGDYGKYHYNGEIEFLGREDNQIKINGHRIELGEVEAAAKKVSGISNSVVLYKNVENEKHLICYYETESKDVKRNKKIDGFIEQIDEKARNLVRNVNKERLIEAIKIRDTAILHSMLWAITENVNQERFSIEEVLKSKKILEKYYWLVSYWLKLLENKKYIKLNHDNKYTIEKEIQANLVFDHIKMLWEDTKIAWLPEMGSLLFYEYLYQCAFNLKKLLCGEVDPIKILYPDGKNDIVNEMYTNNTVSKYLNMCICDFVRRYSDKHDNIRILEIGAGTCATARQVTKTLQGKSYQYYVTDINKFFIPAARKEFEGNKKVEISLLDIDKDIYEQGFQENQYDIIIAVGVLENVKDIRKSLNFINKLIVPSGYLLFTEPVLEEPWILSSQGFLMTKPEDKLRKNSAIISSKKWIELLEELDSGEKTIIFPKEQDSIWYAGLELFIKRLKTNKKNISSNTIKETIKEYLPSYMMPTQYYFMDKMPLTNNGKVDRKKLLELAKTKVKSTTQLSQNAEVMTEQQRKILDILKKAGIDNLSLDDNFYEFGADSLIMAQITGKLREHISEKIPFDTMLRYLLAHPTIREVSEFLNTYKTEQSMIKTMENIGTPQFYEAGNGPLRVVFHAAFGTMNSQRFLVSFLQKQKKGKIMTIALGNPEKFYRMDKDSAVEELADDYLKLILNTGYSKVQLIGYCFGGWLAMNVANRLQDYNVEVVDMALIDCQTVPWIIEDELLLEMMFIPNFNIKYKQIGFKDEKSVEKLFFKIIEKYNAIPQNSVLEEFGVEFKEVQDTFRYLHEMKRDERFRLYARFAYENTGEVVEYEMMKGLFFAFAQTTKAVHCEMQPYIGDVRYFNAKEFSNVFFDSKKDIEYWKELCLGEFVNTEIEGNHFTCVEDEENAQILADKIGNF